MFQELVAQEETNGSRRKITQESIKLINIDIFVAKLIDLMYNLKNNSGEDKQAKIICSLNQKDKSDANPLVDIEIEGYHI